MDTLDHLVGDEWRKLYPNLFPDEQPVPKKPEQYLESSAVAAPVAPKPIMVHAIAQGMAKSLCGIDRPSRATSPYDVQQITCDKCMHIALNRYDAYHRLRNIIPGGQFPR